MTAIVDWLPHHLRRGYRKELFTAFVCLIWFLVGLSMVTEVRHVLFLPPMLQWFTRTSLTETTKFRPEQRPFQPREAILVLLLNPLDMSQTTSFFHISLALNGDRIVTRKRKYFVGSLPPQ